MINKTKKRWPCQTSIRMPRWWLFIFFNHFSCSFNIIQTCSSGTSKTPTNEKRKKICWSLSVVNETKATLFFQFICRCSEWMLKNVQYDTTHGHKAKRPINELHTNHQKNKSKNMTNNEKGQRKSECFTLFYYVITQGCGIVLLRHSMVIGIHNSDG